MLAGLLVRGSQVPGRPRLTVINLVPLDYRLVQLDGLPQLVSPAPNAFAGFGELFPFRLTCKRVDAGSTHYNF